MPVRCHLPAGAPSRLWSLRATVTAELGQHLACSSRGIATLRCRQSTGHSVLTCGAALRHWHDTVTGESLSDSAAERRRHMVCSIWNLGNARYRTSDLRNRYITILSRYRASENDLRYRDTIWLNSISNILTFDIERSKSWKTRYRMQDHLISIH